MANVFQNFHVSIERQFRCKLKSFQSDFDGEFQVLHGLHSYFIKHGIHHWKSCPHPHVQSGMAERKIRHIVDMGLILPAHSKVPLQFWNFAFATLVFTINWVPSRTHIIPPNQKLFKTPSKYSFLKPYGCEAFPLLGPYNKHKFNFQSCSCVLLSYSLSHLGYICFNLSSHKIYIARHCNFLEESFPFENLHVGRINSLAQVSTSSSPWGYCHFQSKVQLFKSI